MQLATHARKGGSGGGYTITATIVEGSVCGDDNGDSAETEHCSMAPGC